MDRRRTADVAEAELLAIAAHWADLHAVLDGDPDGFRVPGMEALVPLAGPGAPEVAEFAPAELGAALGMSSYAGQVLVGDALELRHRLPRLWARVQDGTLPGWRARKIAEHTRGLPIEGAAWVDAQLAPFTHKIGLGRILDAVQAGLVRFDPQAAAKKAKAAADSRGVWTGDQTTDGVREISICANALDAAAFDDTIASIADALARLGDADRVDVRRAKADGVIADPQGTLDLLDAGPDTDTGDGDEDGGAAASSTEDEAADYAGQGETEAPPGSRSGSRRRRGGPRARRRPKVVLYLHLHQDAITGSGVGGVVGGVVGRVEGLGPVIVEQIQDWVGRSEVKIQPVLDLDNRACVDAYEVPDRIDETVFLRNPCCPFPWCNNLSRNKDNDHIEAYVPPDDGGPPGQTAADKIAQPCRRHHRLKTHTGWSYTMPEPGLYLWRSPHGRRYLVDHTGTAALRETG